MRAKDLTGMTFGSLDVLEFDEERHIKDKALKAAGQINRVRRYYICRCSKCGNITSVRGENLLSGNTTGCGCDMYEKSGGAIKKHNDMVYDNDLHCYVGKLSNTDALFIIDEDDFDTVSKYCWYENNCGYAVTRISKSRQILLHRLIMFGIDGAVSDIKIDHINRNKLDCRKINMRTCTDAENVLNRGLSSRNKSGVTGVIWRPNEKKWQAYICKDRRCISLGYYTNKDDAVCARIEAEKRLFKDFAPKHDVLQ